MLQKVSLVLIVLVLIGCNSQEKNLPDDFDFGSIQENVYQNNFFDMEITFDPDWIIQSKQQMNSIQERGVNTISGDSKTLKADIKASMVNTAYLFSLFKYEFGSTVEYNPSFMVVAENTKNFPGIKRGKDYLLNVKKTLKQTELNYTFDKEVYTIEIGGKSFDVMQADLNFFNKTIIQEYFSTVTKGVCLSFILTYSNKDQKSELYTIVNQIKITE